MILTRGKTKLGPQHHGRKTLGPAAFCETKLLPGFRLSCREIFEAAEEIDDN
jgi:hypothetical protein